MANRAKETYWRGRIDTKRLSSTATQIILETLRRYSCVISDSDKPPKVYHYGDSNGSCTIAFDGEDVLDIYSRSERTIKRAARSLGVLKLDSLACESPDGWKDIHAQSSAKGTPRESAEDRKHVDNMLDYICDGKGPSRPILPTGREHILPTPRPIKFV